VCIALYTIIAHNIAQNIPDNFPSYPPDNHHCSDDVHLREGGRDTIRYNTISHKILRCDKIRYNMVRIRHGASPRCDAAYRAMPDPVWKKFFTLDPAWHGRRRRSFQRTSYCLVMGTAPIRNADTVAASHAWWLADCVVARCPINRAGCRRTWLIDSRKQPMWAANSGVVCQ